MNDLSNKLDSGNPFLVAQIIGKFVQTVKNLDDGNIVDVFEYKLLREKCTSVNNSVSVVAAEGILNIAKDSDNAVIKTIIADFISVITTTKCPSSMPYLINNLLLIDLNREVHVNNTYKSSFNLRVPQHPFIIMLNEDSKSWSGIFREMVYSYGNSNSSTICHYDTLYKPIFLYVLCNPQDNHLTAFRQKLWSFLLQKSTVHKDKLLESLLYWMPLENKDSIQLNSDFLLDLATFSSQKRIFDADLLLMLQISVLHQLILNHFDARAIIFNTINSVKNVDNKIILNPALLILTKCVRVCPSVYLLGLLKLCKVIMSEGECDAIVRNAFKSSLLQWITISSEFMLEAVTFANSLFSHVERGKNFERSKGFSRFYKTNQHLLNVNGEPFSSLQIYILLENWKNEQDIALWLQKLEDSPSFFVAGITDFLIGLFVTEFENVTITLKSFDMLLKCVEYDSTLAPNLLTVILFKLSSVRDSNLHYKILKAIPKMATTKSTFQKVVNTIMALNHGNNILKTFSLSLMLDLWKIDSKCYHFLEKLLIAPYDNQGDKWEFYITRAHALKELCALKPELYGKEIVAHLSKILNECNNADEAVASALAIEGITYLCKSEIIDAVTTWATLEPMFKQETRVPVIKSVCGLISEIPSLSYCDAYPKLIEDVIKQLWDYIVVNSTDEVWRASLEALTHFDIDQIVAQIPEDYLDEECVNLRKSGHVVPANCWIQFLKNCSQSKLQIVGDFLIKLVSLEVSGYLKFVYKVKGTREPVDYSYLPVNSVVRGLSAYIKKNVIKFKTDVYKEVYLQCLRVFSQEFSKPLPPLDWCFLQELFHEKETKDFSVNIAAHQVILSGTARRFIVNYIEAVAENHANENDILLVYQNLKHLANSIQPFTIKPVLFVTICAAVERFKSGSEDLLLNILTHIKSTLRNENISEANKFVVAEIISEIFSESDLSGKLFHVLLECVVLFPMKAIDDLSSPKTVKDVSGDWLRKAVKIRCLLAINANATPLNFLNDLIEVGSGYPELTPFIFEEFSAVFKKQIDNSECVLWLLDLIGQIQAMIAERSDERNILFFCDIFILATIVFSGYFVFLKRLSELEELYEIFPRAVATLLDVNSWSICTNQVLEWFYHVVTEKILSNQYRDMFVQSLQCLKGETEFYKNLKWTKYLNVDC